MCAHFSFLPFFLLILFFETSKYKEIFLQFSSLICNGCNRLVYGSFHIFIYIYIRNDVKLSFCCILKKCWQCFNTNWLWWMCCVYENGVDVIFVEHIHIILRSRNIKHQNLRLYVWRIHLCHSYAWTTLKLRFFNQFI